MRAIKHTLSSPANIARPARDVREGEPRLGSVVACVVFAAGLPATTACYADVTPGCDVIVDDHDCKKSLVLYNSPIVHNPSCGHVECSGSVSLEGIIDKDGNVRNVRVTANTMTNKREEFAAAAIRKFEGSHYEKPSIDGKPVCVRSYFDELVGLK